MKNRMWHLLILLVCTLSTFLSAEERDLLFQYESMNPKFKTPLHKVLDIESVYFRKSVDYQKLDSLIKQAKELVPLKKAYSEIEVKALMKVIFHLLNENRFVYRGGINYMSDTFTARKLSDSDIEYIRDFDYEEFMTQVEASRGDPKFWDGRIVVSEDQQQQIMYHASEDYYFADCDMYTNIYLAIGYELKLPLYRVNVPGHAFIRWKYSDGSWINWETTSGMSQPDSYYIEKFHLNRRTIQEERYMQSENIFESISGNISRIAYLYYQEQYDSARALKLYSLAIALNDQDASNFANRAAIWVNEKSYQYALADYQLAIRRAPEMIDIQIQYADLLLYLKYFDECEKIYQSLMKKVPDNAPLYAGYASLLMQKKKMKEALQMIDKALSKEALSEYYCVRAKIYFKLKKYAKALKDCQRVAVRNDASFSKAEMLKADIYFALGENIEAEACFNRILKKEPDSQMVLAERSAFYADSGQHQKAIDGYTRMIKLGEHKAWVYMQRSQSYCSLNRMEEAQLDLQRVLLETPDHEIALLNFGVTYFEQKKYEQAYKYFSKVIKVNPENANAYLNRGSALSSMKRYKEAILDYSSAIALNPSLKNAYIYRDRLQKRMNKK